MVCVLFRVQNFKNTQELISSLFRAFKTRIKTDSLRYDAGQGRDLWRPSVLHGFARKRGNVALFLHVISEAQLGEGIREREFGSDDY